MEPVVMGPSGRPLYTEHEVEVIACSDVEVEGPEGFSGVFLVRLTNFRFLFQNTRPLAATSSSDSSKDAQGTHRMLHWSHIAGTAVGKSIFWWRKPNLTLQLYNASSTPATGNSITLTLASDQFDKLVASVQVQQDRKSWLHYPMEYLIMTGKETAEDASKIAKPKPTPSGPRPTSTSMVGIAGLTRHMEEKHKQVDSSLQEAFKDMDSLFEKAREMVAIANRLVPSARANAEQKQTEEQSHLQSDMMVMMGIRSPVTLGAHDNQDLYLEELSREVDTFVCNNFHLLKSHEQTMRRPVQLGSSNLLSSTTPIPSQTPQLKIGAEVIPLIDLYCIFNRARGTALVSPNDLLEACKRLGPLKLRCRLMELNDGVLAVASESYDETKIAIQVSQLLSATGPLSAAQLSSQQKIGLPLATHYLLRAEAMELACRDHSTEGLIFWPNIFAQPKPNEP